MTQAEQIDAALARRIETLERQVQTIRHEEDIERLQYVYGFYLDGHMWDEMAALFTDDAPSIEIGQRGRYVGKDRILAFYRQVIGGGRSGLRKGEVDNWIQLQWIVTVAPDGLTAKARGRSLNQGIDGQDRGVVRWADGLYENTYVREGDVWKIKAIWWTPTFYTCMPTVGEVWHHSLPPNNDFPPDQPSTPVDPALGRSFPAYHYAHPVTGEATPSPGQAAVS
jgi:hypothetical protein